MREYSFIDLASDRDKLRAMNEDELDALCAEIREFIIQAVEKNGGHLASNLGTVEMTVALHRVFDLPKDRIVFDVGHQSYTHKILSGRKDGFEGLRKRGGMSGFTKRSESEYDCFGAGHSSTSVSAAIGFAEGERLKGSDSYTVAVLGDGAFTGGMIHEALNNCRKDLKLVIVLNENEMSISKNTGSFASLIAKIRASKSYYRTKRRTVSFIKKIPLLGKPLFNGLKSIKQSFKNRLYKSNYFEDLGLYYLGPIDGNDVTRVERLLTEAKNAAQSTVIHLRTVKGKGYEPAENDPGRYHSVSPKGSGSYYSFSKKMGEILSDMADSDCKVCAVTAAMPDGTGLSYFCKTHPERFFDVGIAEEHALTFCAGLASDGFKPYFAVYSSFLQRGYDNLIHDIALQGLPVTILVDRAGISAGDGPTHHGIFDVSFLSSIPNMEIFAPATFDSLEKAMRLSLESDHPIAVRYENGPESEEAKGFIPVCDFVSKNFDYDAETVIITYGRILSEAIKACERNENSGVILLERLKPYGTLADSVKTALPPSVKTVIFLEEGIKNGGAGMILSEYLTLSPDVRYVHLGIDDLFDTDKVSGNIYSDFGIGCDDIVAAAEKKTEIGL